MRKEIPEIVDVKAFDSYMMNVLRPAVLEFNGACGKSPETVNDVEVAVDMIFNECKRVIEECEETIKAYKENDRVERLDGLVDVYWTNFQLTNLYLVFREKFGAEELKAEINSRAFDDVLLQTHSASLVPLAITLGQGTIISGKAILIASSRIIQNNKQKYTKDIEIANDWGKHIDKETQAIRSYTYNGEVFYCIKRLSDDYIVKPYNFKPVELGGL